MRGNTEVIVITLPWDVHLGFIKYHCSRLNKAGVKCRVMMLNDAYELVLKYGVKDGVVKVPVVLLVNNGEIRVIDVYQLRNL